VETLTSRADKKTIILDTSALLAGFDPFSMSEEQYSVPMVRAEIAENSISGVRFKTAEESGKIRVETPDKSLLEKVKAAASTVGDSFFLSDTDIQVLALALQLKMQGYLPLIATDDYSIQNVANQMGIEFASLATFGIRRRLQWMRYCPACHKKYPADYKFARCEVCGTELKRKPYRKEFINRQDSKTIK
jgi:UPF0271 protein